MTHDPPNLLLATDYSRENPAGWWLSEKLDGVRAYWTGERFLSRSGREIEVPRWFTDGLPPQPLDGELWLGRGRFQECSGLCRTRRGSPRYKASPWRHMRFCVFDLPDHGGPFEDRIAAIPALISRCRYAEPVKHQRVSGQRQMRAIYQSVLSKGGEGIMLREPESPYIGRRSDTLLRLKPADQTTDSGKPRFYRGGKQARRTVPGGELVLSCTSDRGMVTLTIYN